MTDLQSQAALDEAENTLLMEVWNQKANGMPLSAEIQTQFYRTCHKRFKHIFNKFCHKNHQVISVLSISYDDALNDFFVYKFYREAFAPLKAPAAIYTAFNNFLMDQYGRNTYAQNRTSVRDEDSGEDNSMDKAYRQMPDAYKESSDEALLASPETQTITEDLFQKVAQSIQSLFNHLPCYIQTIIAYNLCRDERIPVSRINRYFTEINSHAYEGRNWGVTSIRNAADYFHQTKLGKAFKHIFAQVGIEQPEKDPKVLLEILKILCLHASKYENSMIEKELNRG